MQGEFFGAIMKAEFGVLFLALAVLLLDLFLPKEKKFNILSGVAITGVAALFSIQGFEWGKFGYAFNGSFVQDGASLCFKAILLLAAFFVLFMSRQNQSEFARGKGEFTLLTLFALTGAMFLVSANDFLLFFVSLEILSISSYIMTSYLKNDEHSIEAGVKYLILGALSTSLFLFGLSFVYGATGSTNYTAIHQVMTNWQTLPAYFLFGMILILASLGFKVASVPFQLWVPDIYQGAPTSVTAFLATASKTAGFAALLRVVLTVFWPAYPMLITLFSVLAALTIFYGNLGALLQKDIKRLMGYSSIGHAGYLLIGMAVLHETGSEAILFYLLSYVFATAGIFLVLSALASTLKTHDTSELAGLSKRSPVLAASMLISLMSLAGVPPFAGFFAKFFILWSSMRAGFVWLVVIGVLNVILSLYYYLRIVKTMYLDEPATGAPALNVSFDQKIIQIFVMVSIVLMGIFQGPFVQIAQNAFTYFSK